MRKVKRRRPAKTECVREIKKERGEERETGENREVFL